MIMNYETAIQELINQYGREVLDDSFQVRAVLSDFIGSSIHDSRLVSCFCWLNENLGLLMTARNSNLNCFRQTIISFYKGNKSEFVKDEIKASINPLTAILFESEYANWQKKQKAPKEPQVKKPKKKPVVAKEVFEYAPNIIEVLKIRVEVGNVLLRPSKDGKLFITLNGKKLDLSAFVKVRNNNISIDLRRKRGNIAIYIPNKKTIQTIDVKANLSYFSLEPAIKVENLKIDSNRSLRWFGHCQTLDLSSKGSVDVYFADAKSIRIKAERDINYSLFAPRSGVSLSMYSLKGDIRGHFSNGRTCPRVIPWFGSVKQVNAVSYVKGIQIKYDLYAPYGKVKAK